MASTLIDDFLEHYGVKGMHWGERRQLKKTGDARVRAFNAATRPKLDEHSVTTITKKEYASLSSKPIKLASAGSTVNRFAANTDLREFAYASVNEKDHTRYKAFLMVGGGVSGKQKLDLKIQVTKDLVSPSKKERIDTFIKTLDTTIKLNDINGNPMSITGRKYLEEMGVERFTNSAAKAMSNREFGLMAYNQFAQAQVLTTPIHQVYASKIKDRGYNALVDDADAGILSDLPIIIFPEQAGAKVVSVTPVTKDDLIRARSEIEFV